MDAKVGGLLLDLPGIVLHAPVHDGDEGGEGGEGEGEGDGLPPPLHEGGEEG